MRSTRSIALAIALAATPVAAVTAPAAMASETSSASESTTTSSESTENNEDDGFDFPWGLLGLLGLAGLLGGRKKEQPEVGHTPRDRTTDTYRANDTHRTDATRRDNDDVRVVDANNNRVGGTDTRRDGIAGRADDRFGDGDGRLDGDDLPGERR